MKQALIAALLGAGLMVFSAPSLAHLPGHSQSQSLGEKSYKNHHNHHYSDHKAHFKHDRAVRKYKSGHRKYLKSHKHTIKKHRLQHKRWSAHHHHRVHYYRNHYHIHHHKHGRRDNDYLEWLGIMLLLDEALEDDYH